MINNYFNEEKKNVLNTIDKMCVEGCIDNFFAYLNDNDENNGTFEKLYITRLNNDIQLLLEAFLDKYIQSKSPEKIIEEYKDLRLHYDGFIFADLDMYEYRDYFANYSDSYMYEIIKDYMYKVYNNIIEESNISKIKKQKTNLTNTIANYESTIENYQNKINEAKNKLKKLENMGDM